MNGNTNTGSATCPTGSELLSGGWQSNQTNSVTLDVYNSQATTPGLGGTWSVTIGSSAQTTVTPYAICSP